MAFSILTSEKSFTDRWVGNERLNGFGHHKARMTTAAFNARLRRAQVFYRTGKWRTEFAENDFIKLENFLPSQEFEQLSKEVTATADKIRQQSRYQENPACGFGKPTNHAWDYDRFDGGTLNRFIDIDHAVPAAVAFAKKPPIAKAGSRRLSTYSSNRHIHFFHLGYRQ